MPEIVSSPVVLLLVAVLAYLAGSIPFGIVMAKLFGLGDLRKIGSGNIGATNVLRTGNKPAAFLTLVLDAGKGGLAVLAAGLITGNGDAAQLAGLMAFIGHLYPVWIGFKGGKGVATFLGTLLVLHWPLGVTACAIWLVAALLSRISSSGALSAAALSPVAAWFYGYLDLIVLVIVLGALVIWRHRTNIGRILNGTEPRIGQSKGQ
jgi:acyl phosphate:glycerol-3-phosphate acyltransferase